jgi:AcrR family transcriptional regulator
VLRISDSSGGVNGGSFFETIVQVLERGLLMTRMSRRERELIQRRKEVMDAAERVFSRQGFFRARMRDIASEAEFAIGTIYKFFKGKVDLYSAVVERNLQQLWERVKEATEKVSSTGEKLNCLIESQLDYFAEKREFLRIYLSSVVSSVSLPAPGELQRRLRRLYQRYADRIGRLLSDASRRELSPGEIKHAALGLLNSLLTTLAEKGEKAREMIKRSLLARIMVQGLGKV